MVNLFHATGLFHSDRNKPVKKTRGMKWFKVDKNKILCYFRDEMKP